MQIRNPGAALGIRREYRALLAGGRAVRGVRLVNGNVCAPEIASSAGDAGALGAKAGRGLLGNYDEQQVRSLVELRARVLLTLDGMRQPPSAGSR